MDPQLDYRADTQQFHRATTGATTSNSRAAASQQKSRGALLPSGLPRLPMSPPLLRARPSALSILESKSRPVEPILTPTRRLASSSVLQTPTYDEIEAALSSYYSADVGSSAAIAQPLSSYTAGDPTESTRHCSSSSTSNRINQTADDDAEFRRRSQGGAPNREPRMRQQQRNRPSWKNVYVDSMPSPPGSEERDVGASAVATGVNDDSTLRQSSVVLQRDENGNVSYSHRAPDSSLLGYPSLHTNPSNGYLSPPSTAGMPGAAAASGWRSATTSDRPVASPHGLNGRVSIGRDARVLITAPAASDNGEFSAVEMSARQHTPTPPPRSSAIHTHLHHQPVMMMQSLPPAEPLIGPLVSVESLATDSAPRTKSDRAATTTAAAAATTTAAAVATDSYHTGAFSAAATSAPSALTIASILPTDSYRNATATSLPIAATPPSTDSFREAISSVRVHHSAYVSLLSTRLHTALAAGASWCSGDADGALDTILCLARSQQRYSVCEQQHSERLQLSDQRPSQHSEHQRSPQSGQYRLHSFALPRQEGDVGSPIAQKSVNHDAPLICPRCGGGSIGDCVLLADFFRRNRTPPQDLSFGTVAAVVSTIADIVRCSSISITAAAAAGTTHCECAIAVTPPGLTPGLLIGRREDTLEWELYFAFVEDAFSTLAPAIERALHEQERTHDGAVRLVGAFDAVAGALSSVINRNSGAARVSRAFRDASHSNFNLRNSGGSGASSMLSVGVNSSLESRVYSSLRGGPLATAVAWVREFDAWRRCV